MRIVFEGKGPAGYMPAGQLMVIGRRGGSNCAPCAVRHDNQNAPLNQRKHWGTIPQSWRGPKARN